MCCVLINFHAERAGAPEQRTVPGGDACPLRLGFRYCLSKASAQSSPGAEAWGTRASSWAEGHHVSLKLPTFSCNPGTCCRMIFYKIKWGLSIYSQIYLLLMCHIQVISSLGVLLSVKLCRSSVVKTDLHWPTELAHIPLALCCRPSRLTPFLCLDNSSKNGTGCLVN